MERHPAFLTIDPVPIRPPQVPMPCDSVPEMLSTVNRFLEHRPSQRMTFDIVRWSTWTPRAASVHEQAQSRHVLPVIFCERRPRSVPTILCGHVDRSSEAGHGPSANATSVTSRYKTR